MPAKSMSIERMKSLNMVEFLIDHYGMRFSRCGNQYISLSPFVIEKKPSFFVGKVGNHWLFKDFSSGYGGSLIDFVLLKEGFSKVSQALVYIRGLIYTSHRGLEETCVSLSLPCALTGSNKRTTGSYDITYIYRKLSSNDNAICRDYLIRRGISRRLTDRLCADGILLHNRYNKKSYCCFAVFDHKRQLCCLDNHRIGGNEKFILGNKHIFSLDLSILSRTRKVFVCEGIIDYLSIKVLEDNRLPGIALLGNIPNFDPALLKSAELIISAFDNDRAGRHGFLELKKKFYDKQFRVYRFSNCKDANEYLQKVIAPLNCNIEHQLKQEQLDNGIKGNVMLIKNKQEAEKNEKHRIGKSGRTLNFYTQNRTLN